MDWSTVDLVVEALLEPVVLVAYLIITVVLPAAIWNRIKTGSWNMIDEDLR